MGGMGMNGTSMNTSSTAQMDQGPPNYFRYPDHSTWIYGHIFAMVIAWTVVLPLGVMFSIAKSLYTIPTQTFFFILNGIGVFLSVVYDAKTPDLYENNAHHKIGWIFTWMALAWILMGIVNTYAGRYGARQLSGQQVSAANLARYSQLQNDCDDDHDAARWSGDSGQGSERNSYSLFGSGSPGTNSESRPFDDQFPSLRDVNLNDVDAEKISFLRSAKLHRYLSRKVPQLAVGKTLAISQVLYTVSERLIIILGWVALLTGAVTFGGIFRGSALLNGLAHWVKGSIFFWYGLLTLGRWMGAFADFGWAWNVKPGIDLVARWKTRIPSAEFTESFVIFLYGISNVWLEHLSAWGGAWAPSDYEHVAITILFFGGGLLGMLIESHWIRDLLSTHILTIHEDSHPTSTSTTKQPQRTQPNHYTVPLNPLPALVILLLGIMMSSHTQSSMTSSMIHKQWGQLFVGYALSRGVTYLLLYIKIPTSHLPARPPTEIITSFCLVSGGLVFMASSRDVVTAMERNGLDAMFGFTVTMGVTALVMAWVVVCLAVKGWAVRKERAASFPPKVERRGEQA
ncbi:hypothetical protein EJ08DRAFT_668669 [Tothia fuscella]|uniref:Integral membrane protein n=1 Tax=Tothia fuscella TaxID=1048955 RepID=A0A9P4U276_9PEZI|nr:hypothetical protein EJ08DRAFT_668669 [Tothia fuscella]